MSTENILEELDNTREELMRLRFQMTTGELSDHSQVSIAKRKIARLLTILGERKTEKTEGDA
jgi:large subunit ribosomal protein L29